jgi:vacuolar-type H+-ATPase subunit F/Vma7
MPSPFIRDSSKILLESTLLGFVIGDSNMVTGFRLVGVKGVEVTSVIEARENLQKALAGDDVALIIVSQQFSTQMQDDIVRVRASRVSPIILELPGAVGPSIEIKLSDLISKTLGIAV